MSQDSEVKTDFISESFKKVQDHICHGLADLSGQNFLEENWTYHKGTGGGRTRVWEATETHLIEKGGVNFSDLIGTDLPSAAVEKWNIPKGSTWRATGVSLVIHPSSPHVPTIHMNVRYFEVAEANMWWFGGGVDVTPYYPHISNVVWFHQALKTLCEKHNQSYPTYKEYCDKYFLLPHRGETRGVGGIFFDQLSDKCPEAASNPSAFTKKALLDFTSDLGFLFSTIFSHFAVENRLIPVTPEQRQYQLLRRGRYVEFNLIYDRGTKFGFQSEGRTESILMSLPPTTKWQYNWKPEEGTQEDKIMKFFHRAQDWLSIDPSTFSL
eukprot:TRINITY_DN535_c0_g1_i2.p1 TRINITY_DN535_c0_g1~~TRINITY_DN535_c0_g1_i2.p1  ORF type:complete len:339 (-),score=92.49 TRINITY_DN535_c0_g1_i2:143-1114(-)